MTQVWRKCSSCKADIAVKSPYYVCSVSTCRQKKTNYVFCSVECWDRHIPVERHRSADIGAIEKIAPDSPYDEGASTSEQGAEAPKRRRVIATTAAQPPKRTKTSVDQEVLVVASKVKKYISERSRMNTSAGTMDALSDRVRAICEVAIQNAREDGRKTVMDRDIP